MIRSLLPAVVLLATVGCGGTGDEATATTGTSTTSTTAPDRRAPACTAAAPAQSPEQLEVTVDGTPRSALVHVPPSAPPGEPLPVVVSFHGVSGTGSLQRTTDGFDVKADEQGFVVVYPDGLEVGLNDQVTGISGWDADGSSVDEVAFATALLEELGATVCIDTSRVYATGFSAGGNIALVVACALPDRFAAVATVSAAFQPGECESAPAVPMMAFHGLDDIVVPFDGRDTPEAGTMLRVRDVLDAQAARNGCTGEPTTTEVTPRVLSLTWNGCRSATTLVALSDHGHAWPGHPLPFDRATLAGVFAGNDTQPPNPLMVAIDETPERMADNTLLTNTDVDASDLIWDFFSTAR